MAGMAGYEAMNGKSRTAAEIEFQNRISQVGCIACRHDGNRNDYVSIHHIRGRTQKGAHYDVLPLCAGHHQDGTGNDKSMIAVHPWKARFEAWYGTQYELLDECLAIIGED